MAAQTRWLCIPICLLASSAVASGDRVANHVTMTDDPPNARFVLHYQNDTHHIICLSSALWPNDAGNIPLTAPPDIWVSVGQKKFPLDTFIEDPPGAGVKVKARTGVTAYLNYSAFKLPDALVHGQKHLHLVVAGYRCH